MTLDEVLELRQHTDRQMDFASDIVKWAFEVAEAIRIVRDTPIWVLSGHDAIANLLDVAAGAQPMTSLADTLRLAREALIVRTAREFGAADESEGGGQ